MKSFNYLTSLAVFVVFLWSEAALANNNKELFDRLLKAMEVDQQGNDASRSYASRNGTLNFVYNITIGSPLPVGSVIICSATVSHQGWQFNNPVPYTETVARLATVVRPGVLRCNLPISYLWAGADTTGVVTVGGNIVAESSAAPVIRYRSTLLPSQQVRMPANGATTTITQNARL